MAKKPSLGRQKIKIAKIEKNSHLQVTFSKRRFGLFKKASELVTLCGVEISIIVSSPGGKVFSFGHPNIDAIVAKFLNHPSLPSNFAIHSFAEALSGETDQLNLQLEKILDEIEAERKRGKILDNMKKDCVKSYWWRAPIENLSLVELEQIKGSMEELKKNVTNEANKYFVGGLDAQADLSRSSDSFGEQSPCQIFDFPAKSITINYLGYNREFSNLFGEVQPFSFNV